MRRASGRDELYVNCMTITNQASYEAVTPIFGMLKKLTSLNS